MGYVRDGRISTNAFTKPADTPPYRSNAAPDHGLFVADIIHRIAPHAGLHLLHVLDDRGYGRGVIILDALDYCLDALVRPDRRLVINLSLFLLVPPRDAPDAASASVSAEELAREVKTRVARLIAAGAVVVAAAGNDALDYEHEWARNSPCISIRAFPLIATASSVSWRPIAAASSRLTPIMPIPGSTIVLRRGAGKVFLSATTRRCRGGCLTSWCRASRAVTNAMA